MTRPTQPIMPETATDAAVSSVAQRMTVNRSRRVFTPIERASSSPSVSRFMRQLRIHSGTSPSVTGITRNSTSRGLMEDRLPISQ